MTKWARFSNAEHMRFLLVCATTPIPDIPDEMARHGFSRRTKSSYYNYAYRLGIPTKRAKPEASSREVGLICALFERGLFLREIADEMGNKGFPKRAIPFYANKAKEMGCKRPEDHERRVQQAQGIGMFYKPKEKKHDNENHSRET